MVTGGCALPWFHRKAAPPPEAAPGGYAREVLDAYQGIRALRHDLKHHLEAIEGLALASDTPGILAYIAELRGELRAYESILLSGNVVVDALVSRHMRVARESGIDMQAHVVLPFKTPLSPPEWSALLGNLLQNAREACMRAGVAEPYIRLHISFTGGELVLRVENASAGAYARKGQGFISEKTGAPGAGLAQVAAVVRRHAGHLSLDAQSAAFTATILLPLEE